MCPSRTAATIGAALSIALSAALPAAATTVLYTQDFENPTGFVNRVGDLDYVPVNNLYGNQPVGFQFGNTWTVETLLVGGNVAWGGNGYQDPQGRAGRYAIGMLSTVQDDLLGLSFNVASYTYLNFQLDISSIDLNCCGGAFDPGNITAPVFRISLFDNPSGVVGVGSGTPLDFEDITGTVGPNSYTFDWTNYIVALDATGNTNGNVTLRIDLLQGGYAAIDNFRIAASDTAGNTGNVPEPATAALVLLGLVASAASRRRLGTA